MAVQAQVIARPAESPTARIAHYQAEADLALSLWQDLERLLENNKLRDGDGLTPEEVKRLSGKACKARATYWCKRDKIERLRAQVGPRVEVLPLERGLDCDAQIRGSAALPVPPHAHPPSSGCYGADVGRDFRRRAEPGLSGSPLPASFFYRRDDLAPASAPGHPRKYDE